MLPASLSQQSLLEAVKIELAALLKDLGRWVDACVWFGLEKCGMLPC
jgi:hypothetical protein